MDTLNKIRVNRKADSKLHLSKYRIIQRTFRPNWISIQEICRQACSQSRNEEAERNKEKKVRLDWA